MTCHTVSRYQIGSGVNGTGRLTGALAVMNYLTMIPRLTHLVSSLPQAAQPRLEEHDVTRDAEIWSRYLVKQLEQNTDSNHHRYVWYQMAFFALRNASGRTTVLCFDTPDRFRLRLLEDLSSNSRGANEPDIHQLHTFLVDQILNLYDASVWALRDIVRNVERVSGVAVE